MTREYEMETREEEIARIKNEHISDLNSEIARLCGRISELEARTKYCQIEHEPIYDILTECTNGTHTMTDCVQHTLTDLRSEVGNLRDWRHAGECAWCICVETAPDECPGPWAMRDEVDKLDDLRIAADGEIVRLNRALVAGLAALRALIEEPWGDARQVSLQKAISIVENAQKLVLEE